MGSQAGDCNELSGEVWDDDLLVKAYENSVNMAKEELARRISLATNNNSKNLINVDNFRVGDYVRATYDDGIDYEAKILSIDEIKGTCILKYVGYENEQDVCLCDLIASWGKQARRTQFLKAKNDIQLNNKGDVTKSKSSNLAFALGPLPPTPPMPPHMLNKKLGSAEQLSAMLMSWYMSGYYTGIYEGQLLANENKTNKKYGK